MKIKYRGKERDKIYFGKQIRIIFGINAKKNQCQSTFVLRYYSSLVFR